MKAAETRSDHHDLYRRLHHDRRVKSNGELKELRALVHLLDPYRREAVIGIGATALWAILLLVPSYLTKLLIDDAIANDDRTLIVVLAIVSAGLVVALFALMALQKLMLYNTSYRVVVSLQHLVFEQLVRLPSTYHDSHSVGSSVSKLTNDIWACRRLITNGLPMLITSLISVLGSITLMFLLDWDLALMTLLVLPVLVLISALYRRWVSPMYVRMRVAIGDVTDAANETLGVVGLIQSYNQEERHQRAYRGVASGNRDAEYRTIRAGSIYFPSTSIVTAVATGLLIMYGGVQVVRGNSEVGTMVAFFGYLQMFLGPLAGFSSIYQSYQSGVAALGNALQVIDEQPTHPDHGEVLPSLPEGVSGSVALVGLQLGAGDMTDTHAPPPLDVDITSGSNVAFVGGTSSGRTRIGHVLAGLDPPSSGRVMFDGVDAATLAPVSLFQNVCLASDRTGLFHGTVGENLRLAVPDAGDDELLDGLRELFGPAFVRRLGRGLDTPVGRDGSALPAGMRQAIVIARAALRRPRVLVVDGALDSLDAETLARLARSRETILAGVTILTVTNQPLIAGYADTVFVLDEGTVVETGPPDALLAADGHFAALMRRWRSGLAPTP